MCRAGSLRRGLGSQDLARGALPSSKSSDGLPHGFTWVRRGRSLGGPVPRGLVGENSFPLCGCKPEPKGSGYKPTPILRAGPRSY
jgi:hypothetical protein